MTAKMARRVPFKGKSSQPGLSRFHGPPVCFQELGPDRMDKRYLSIPWRPLSSTKVAGILESWLFHPFFSCSWLPKPAALQKEDKWPILSMIRDKVCVAKWPYGIHPLTMRNPRQTKLTTCALINGRWQHGPSFLKAGCDHIAHETS